MYSVNVASNYVVLSASHIIAQICDYGHCEHDGVGDCWGCGKGYWGRALGGCCGGRGGLGCGGRGRESGCWVWGKGVLDWGGGCWCVRGRGGGSTH